ncbi:MAG: SDR family NAD(P)-dependent oxidoreductase [Porticoccaceae bacterium]|jgi:NAD(P)-dependent dehydrogenase (short-subunit alcohol dehydrogenase family)
MDKTRLNGKVAIITGGAKGMGAAHSRLISERGGAVVIADIDDANGETLAAEINNKGGRAIYVNHDVTDENSWKNTISAANKAFGDVNVLINNAGVATVKPVNEATVEDFYFVFDVNVKGTFLGCKHILPTMKNAGGGSIVNISSSSSAKAVMPNLSLYSASKAAVKIFTKTCALDYVQHHIRVNAIHPGLVRTSLNEELMKDPEFVKTALGTTLMDRPGYPEEVAEAAAFLASDASSYMTGADIAVDGGWTAT